MGGTDRKSFLLQRLENQGNKLDEDDFGIKCAVS